MDYSIGGLVGTYMHIYTYTCPHTLRRFIRRSPGMDGKGRT